MSHIDFPAKHGFAIINLVGESVNSTVKYQFVNTWGYGDMRYPKKLKGMMGDLMRNEIHLAGNLLELQNT